MEPSPQPPPASPAPRTGCLKWPSIAAITIAAIVALTLWLSLDKLNQIAATIFGGAAKTDITQTFRENLIKVTATNGDILEVGTLDMDETFTRYNAKTVAWNLVYLGTTVSEIRAPAVFRYHVKLSDAWKVTVDGDRCVVIAPIIRPSLPPSIRTEKMEKKSTNGWARLNAAENLADLERSITPSLEVRAATPEHIAKVRDPARQAVAKFAKAWLLDGSVDRPQDIKDIVVVFADEPAAKSASTLAKQPASVKLLP